ncbi:hypothetical protein GW17_00051175 [Ensete ventricosum]|nr:hypothetical protein GW17_00051175 [Ensete ventricosum]
MYFICWVNCNSKGQYNHILGQSQVRTSGRGSDDAMGARQEFAEGWPRFGRCCQDIAENSSEVCREIRWEFADRLSGARLVFVRRMLEVRWEFAVGNRELVENSLEVYREVRREFADRLSRAHREFAERMLGVRRRKLRARRRFIERMPGVR